MKIVFVGVVLLLLSPNVTSAQAAVSPDSVMQLNRSGRWTEAAALAEQIIASSDQLSFAERCQLRYNLAYSYSMIDRRDAARAEARQVLTDCEALGETWVTRETRRLFDELDPDRIPQPTIRADDGWSRSDPANMGLNPAALAEHETLCRESGADACLVAYRGVVVQEWYGSGYREPMNTMSSVKSWTALIAGLLIAEERLDVDDPVLRWIPEWRAGVEAGVTVRNLLSMTAGLNRRNESETSVGRVGDKNAFVLALPLTYRPGERWEYSNEGVQLLSPILERAAGIPLEDYARKRLFLPLDMRDTELRLDEAGNAWTYADAKTTLRDFAKICQAVLDHGRSLTGRQVVPESWIAEITEPLPQNQGYGLLWWLEDGGGVVATRGHLNTDCIAIRPLGLVIARMQRRPTGGAEPYYGPRFQTILRNMMRP